MDIIDFFRSIDGVLYYVLLVVNTILIFAIIGYLGEKNNQKLIKMSLNTPMPNNNGAMDFSTTITQKHNDVAMPTVAPTVVSNDVMQNNNVPNNMTSPYPNNNLVALNQINNQNMSNQTTGTIPNVQQSVSIPNNQTQINNEIDPNEKAPAVLVINSQNTDMPK